MQQKSRQTLAREYKQTSNITRILADLVCWKKAGRTFSSRNSEGKATESGTKLHVDPIPLFHSSVSHPNLAETPCDRLISSDQTLAWAILVDTGIPSIRR